MIPELGHFSLILGLAFALLLASVPLYGSARKDQYLVRYAWPRSEERRVGKKCRVRW